MKTRDALWSFLLERRLRTDSSTLEEYVEDPWLRARIRGKLLPVFPTWGYKRALVKHDLHHMLAQYGTDFRGELELAGWELASGGCGWSVPFWLDRLFGVLIGLVWMPRRIIAAMRAGWGCRNLYLKRLEVVLAMELDEVRGLVGQ